MCLQNTVTQEPDVQSPDVLVALQFPQWPQVGEFSSHVMLDI